MNNIIKILSENSFIRFNNWLEDEDGHLNPVFIGEFIHPDKGSIQAFCKIYNPEKKGLVNEIIGYLVTHALSVTQPETAFIAQLPSTKLTGLTRIAKRSPNVWMQSKPSKILCFCTSRLDGQSAAIHLTKQPADKITSLIQLIANDISCWPQYPNAIALDENIAHADRHYNNLLRLSKENYALIDNGRLINDKDENWQINDLLPELLTPNKLLKAIEHRNITKPTALNIQSQSVICAEGHEEKLKTVADELDFWINLLLPKEEREPLQRFLTNRTKETSCLLKTRFHMI